MTSLRFNQPARSLSLSTAAGVEVSTKTRRISLTFKQTDASVRLSKHRVSLTLGSAVLGLQLKTPRVGLELKSRPVHLALAPVARSESNKVAGFVEATVDLVSGQIVRVDATSAYPTGCDDPKAATWQLAVCLGNALQGARIRIQQFGKVSDSAYQLQPGALWLGSIADRYAKQQHPIPAPGVVAVLLGHSAGGTDWMFDPQDATTFVGET